MMRTAALVEPTPFNNALAATAMMTSARAERRLMPYPYITFRASRDGLSACAAFRAAQARQARQNAYSTRACESCGQRGRCLYGWRANSAKPRDRGTFPNHRGCAGEIPAERNLSVMERTR